MLAKQCYNLIVERFINRQQFFCRRCVDGTVCQQQLKFRYLSVDKRICFCIYTTLHVGQDTQAAIQYRFGHISLYLVHINAVRKQPS